MWKERLNTTKGGEAKATFNNLSLALEHLTPWSTDSWYDVVRDRGMIGTAPLDDTQIWKAARTIEQQTAMPIRNLKLVGGALRAHCHQTPRDLLQEWLGALPRWDGVERLTEWLSDHAGVAKTPYTMEVSRLLPVSMVKRATDPGCQCRSVVIFEGEENIGKSKLVEILAGPEWYRDVSGSLEGKEAHMILKGAWVVELSELSSWGKTEEARLKAFITMTNDEFIPKYANDPIKLARRTILVGTVNPEGDRTYLRGQTGNTRFYPLELTAINVADVRRIREQLFAEALQYVQDHPTDWWRLSDEAERQAQDAREERRQHSPYETDLETWIERTKTTVIWWERLALEYLELPRDRWSDRRTQMEIAKSLFALGWRKGKRERMAGVGLVVPWRKV